MIIQFISILCTKQVLTKFDVTENDMHVIAAVWYFFAKRDSISLHEW